MRIEVAYIAIVALFWGGWPLVARSAGYGGPLGSLLLSLFSIAAIGVLALLEDGAVRPSGPALAKLAVAGTMMGLGLVAFHLLANSELEASVAIPVVDAAMLLVSAFGAVLFFGESLTFQKGIGIALLVAGIAMLRPT